MHVLGRLQDFWQDVSNSRHALVIPGVMIDRSHKLKVHGKVMPGVIAATSSGGCMGTQRDRSLGLQHSGDTIHPFSCFDKMRGGRKNLKQGVLEGRFELLEGEFMRVVSLRGSNIVEVEDKDGEKTLCLLPAKFNKSLWIKKGSYVVVDGGNCEKALQSGSKVTGIIAQVLFEEHLRKLRKTQLWPAAFKKDEEQLLLGKTKKKISIDDTKSTAVEVTNPLQDINDASNDHGSSSEDEGLPPLEVNQNRLSAITSLSDSSEEDDTGSEDEATC